MGWLGVTFCSEIAFLLFLTSNFKQIAITLQLCLALEVTCSQRPGS